MKQIAEMLEDKSQLPVYLYSGQKLRTQDILQEKLRERLSKDRHATDTYSRDFQSLALSMINPEALRQTEEQDDRKKWTTQRGFVYSAPRQPGEYCTNTPMFQVKLDAKTSVSHLSTT
ncbi:hypothetical protein PF002_g4376 [Phytophthora fragariae]|nr:hypothetical protein PF002_g4376 [Phytophthora fragariae]